MGQTEHKEIAQIGVQATSILTPEVAQERANSATRMNEIAKTANRIINDAENNSIIPPLPPVPDFTLPLVVAGLVAVAVLFK